jgi:hypothetical protein
VDERPPKPSARTDARRCIRRRVTIVVCCPGNPATSALGVR